MKWLICLVALASQLAGTGTAADPPRSNAEGVSAAAKLPPVLRPTEAPDSGQITLPGPPPVTPKKIAPVPPVAQSAPVPATIVEEANLREPIPVPVVGAAPKHHSPIRPVPPKTAPVSPFAPEVAAFCQKQIGHWKEADARKSFGEPKRNRPAYDEKKAVNGTIFAFSDPTGKYKELELDFDAKSGTLRTVFLYPAKLTWLDCRRVWTGPVSAADAAQGRKFYSYTNRRLDVLVDPAGKVISLGGYG